MGECLVSSLVDGRTEGGLDWKSLARQRIGGYGGYNDDIAGVCAIDDFGLDGTSVQFATKQTDEAVG